MKFFMHYKNKPYRYIDTVKHSETLEDLVLYECRYPNPSGKLWVRPKKMFFESVKVQVGEKLLETPRFREIPLKIDSLTTVAPPLIDEIRHLVESSIGPWDAKWFEAGLKDRSQILLLIARVEGKAVGFKLGYLLDSSTYYSWLGGVLPEYRGVGVALDLMKEQHCWCQGQGFKKIQTKTQNRFKAMLLLNLEQDFEIIGYEDSPEGPKIILEKSLLCTS